MLEAVLIGQSAGMTVDEAGAFWGYFGVLIDEEPAEAA